MKRVIELQLDEWANETLAKPLLLRGARQVGKTYSARKLGRKFKYFAEVNFEESPEASNFFAGALTARPIRENLELFTGIPLRDGETLLFLDEIQACPRAIAALRYFREQLPGLHIIAAGSLLEFALQQTPSLGVGRLTSLFMYPMTFAEFLEANGEAMLLEAVNRADFDHPVDAVFHHRLCERFRTFLLVGGMPEAVASWTSKRDYSEVMRILGDMLQTFEDDFVKYNRRMPLEKLSRVFRSVAEQGGGQFVCSHVDQSAKSTSIITAFELLEKAGLVNRAVHSAASGIPLGAQENPRIFKAFCCDTGLQQRLLKLNLQEFATATDAELVNKGALAEVAVGLQLMALQDNHFRTNIHYWRRTSQGSNAEVDYVFQLGDEVVPVEVKSGGRGSMQSLRVFMSEKNSSFGVRVAMENFGRVGNILVLPLYAMHRLNDTNLLSVKI